MKESERGLLAIIAINLIIWHIYAGAEDFDKGYQEEEITISLEIDFGENEPNNLNVENINGTYVFSVEYTTHYTNSWWIWTLVSAEYNISYTSTYYPSLGEMMESIDGIGNKNQYDEDGNATSGRYWALYNDEEYAETGASSTYLTDGDSMMWKIDMW